MKKYMGTIMITAVGMLGTGGGWGIGPVGHSLAVTVGGIAGEPCLTAGAQDGPPANRERLCLTITLDHDLINGAPAARFIQQFKTLVECAAGLSEEDRPGAGEGAN